MRNLVNIICFVFTFAYINLQDSEKKIADKINNVFTKIAQSTYTPKKRVTKYQKEKTKTKIIKKLQSLNIKNKKVIFIVDEFEKKAYLIKEPDVAKNIPVQRNVILHNYINDFLQKYSPFLPFTLPSIKKYLHYLQSYNNKDNKTKDILLPYIQIIKQWSDEMLNRLTNFWYFFKFFFTDDEKRFEYLHKNLCPNEIHSIVKKINRAQIFLDWLNNKNTMQSIVPDPSNFALNSFLNTFQNLDGISYYYLSPEFELKKYGENFFKHKFLKIINNSVCNNLAVLHHYMKIVFNPDKLMPQIKRCINSFANKEKSNYVKKCKRISESIEHLYTKAKLYFYYQEKIFKKKILPEIFDMCYNKCLCADYGIDCSAKDKQNLITRDSVTYLVSRILTTDSESFLINLSTLLENVDIATLYNDTLRKKCVSSEYITKDLENLKNNQEFINEFKNTYSNWKTLQTYKDMVPNGLYEKLYTTLIKIEKLKSAFEKQNHKENLINIFKNEKDVVCKFLTFTRLFSKIGYSNALNITYDTLMENILSSKETLSSFMGMVVYKTIMLRNSIKYIGKDIKFFDLSVIEPKNVSDISDAVNIFSEWLYGRTYSSLFTYYAGFVTFFDYYLFLFSKHQLVENYDKSIKNTVFDCILNKKEFLQCIVLGLKFDSKQYFKKIKKFLTNRKVYKIKPGILKRILHKLNPASTGMHLYTIFDEAKNCCEKFLKDLKWLPSCGQDNNICNIKYIRINYIRKRGENRLKEILGEKLFNFLQQEIKILTKSK